MAAQACTRCAKAVTWPTSCAARRIACCAAAPWRAGALVRRPPSRGDRRQPVVLLFRQFIDKVEASRGDSPLPASLACEALHELRNEARHAERGRLTLSTVDGAKGREFRHVVILDGDNWRRADEEERRLYYVAMRRERGRRWRSARPTATATLSRRRSPPLSSGATPCRRPSSGRRSSRCAPATAVSSVVWRARSSCRPARCSTFGSMPWSGERANGPTRASCPGSTPTPGGSSSRRCTSRRRSADALIPTIDQDGHILRPSARTKPALSRQQSGHHDRPQRGIPLSSAVGGGGCRTRRSEPIRRGGAGESARRRLRRPADVVGARLRSPFSIGSDVRLGEVATTPDLAILCASLDLVPYIIRQLGARGTRGVIVEPWMWHKMSRSEIAAARQGIL